MDRTVIYALLILAGLGFANSQSYLTASPNVSMIAPHVNGSYSQTVGPQGAYADSYVVSLLGQNYSIKYVSLAGGSYYGNVSYVYFTYSSPFANGTQTGHLPGGRELGITVALNGSRITDYIGPAKNFTLNVSSSTAEETAESYGLYNDTTRLVGLFGTNTTSFSNYSVAWAVLSHEALKGQNNYGIYVDAVTGNVAGEFYYLPSEVQNSSTQGYGTAGDFSPFLLTPAVQTQAPLPMYVYYMIFAVIVVAAIIAWIKFKPKKKSRFTDVLSGASS